MLSTFKSAISRTVLAVVVEERRDFAKKRQGVTNISRDTEALAYAPL